MGKISTADRVHDIALEVASYRPDYNEQCGDIAEDLGRRKAVRGNARQKRLRIASLASTALGHSHAVIKQAERHILPTGRIARLTRRTLAMTALAGTSLQAELANELDECCLGAELKFVHGLEYHSLDKQPSPGHSAALILHDAEDEPFAYQKAVGHPYAYVWRDGLMRTRAGPRFLPAGSIVKPIYDRDSHGQPPPHEKFAGAGLMGITGCVADDVEFKRFSLEFFPEEIRRAGLLDASTPDTYGEYRHHAKEARKMNSAAFAGCIAGLAENTENYRIA